MFSQQSKEVFELELNNLFGVFARVWKIKERVFGKRVLFQLLYLSFSFSQGFFFVILISIPLVFSTLELKSTISFYRIFV